MLVVARNLSMFEDDTRFLWWKVGSGLPISSKLNSCQKSLYSLLRRGADFPEQLVSAPIRTFHICICLRVLVSQARFHWKTILIIIDKNNGRGHVLF